MAALSHGVVRVDSEDSLTSLTLQDCGQVIKITFCLLFMDYFELHIYLLIFFLYICKIR